MAQDGTSRGRFVATLALVTLVTAFVGSLVSLRLGGHTTDPADNAPPTFRRIRLFNGTGKDFQAGKTKVFYKPHNGSTWQSVPVSALQGKWVEVVLGPAVGNVGSLAVNFKIFDTNYYAVASNAITVLSLDQTSGQMFTDFDIYIGAYTSGANVNITLFGHHDDDTAVSPGSLADGTSHVDKSHAVTQFGAMDDTPQPP